MTNHEALETLHQATASMPLNRADHMQILEALKTLNTAAEKADAADAARKARDAKAKAEADKVKLERKARAMARRLADNKKKK